jgi:hypothetical protein
MIEFTKDHCEDIINTLPTMEEQIKVIIKWNDKEGIIQIDETILTPENQARLVACILKMGWTQV